MIVKTRFHSLLETRVNEEIEKIKDTISNGVGDNLAYWRCVGEIAGLRGALRLCDDIEQDLDR